MKWIGSSENLLTQQPVDSHLPLFHRAVRRPGQNLIELERKASARVSVRLRTRVRVQVRTRVRVGLTVGLASDESAAALQEFSS